MAHKRSMRRCTVRRSKERQYMRHIKDAQYEADRKGVSGPSSMLAAGISATWTTMVAYCEGKVRVGRSMVPRGREVQANEWEELHERTRVSYNPAVKIAIVPNNDKINGAVEGGKDALFFSNADNARLRGQLCSGKPREEFLALMEEVRSDAARQRATLALAKLRREGSKALGVRERGAGLVPSLR